MNNKKKLLLALLFSICFLVQSHDTTQKVSSIESTKYYISMNDKEKIPSALEFLYKNSAGKAVRYCLTKPWASSFAGWFCNRRFSSYCIKPFIATHNIDMAESANPPEHFRTFNDFFIRKLKNDVRPFDPHPSTVISPADGTVLVIGNITNNMHFPVKESNFNLSSFLADKNLAHDYEGGTLLLFRLAPWDYHRFHFPITCTPSHATTIKGIYESVHPFSYCCGIQPLTQNERHLMLLKTEQFGTVAMISVGALFVGAIIETYPPNKLQKKGSEAGYFCFGGSTVVLLFQKNTLEIKKEYIGNSKLGKETPLKMGTTIGFHRKNK